MRERTLLKTHAIMDTQTEIVNGMIDKVIERGIEQGWGVEKIQRAMRDDLIEGLTEINRFQAERIARTEVIGASNTGSFEGAKEEGVAIGKEWMTSGLPNIRQSHLDYEAMGTVDMDYEYNTGLQYPGDPNGDPDEIINCYIGETNISSYIVKAQRSYYSGKVIEIITSGGKSLTVTPNHNILTSNGFVPACRLTKGNELICDSTNFNVISWIKNHINKKKTFAANIFRSLSNLWFIDHVMIGTLDFNGDGRFMNKEIDIINPNRGLTFNNKIIVQDFGNFRFKHSRTKASLVKRFCSFHFGFNGMVRTPNRLMCFFNLCFSFRKRHLRPFKFFSIGTPPNIDTSFYKSASKNPSLDMEVIGELFHTNPRVITLDQVSKIRNKDFVGHVYDFTSLTGTNIANNIYTSNCRCVPTYVTD
jgi:hypothetical protein